MFLPVLNASMTRVGFDLTHLLSKSTVSAVQMKRKIKPGFSLLPVARGVREAMKRRSR